MYRIKCRSKQILNHNELKIQLRWSAIESTLLFLLNDKREVNETTIIITSGRIRRGHLFECQFPMKIRNPQNDTELWVIFVWKSVTSIYGWYKIKEFVLRGKAGRQLANENGFICNIFVIKNPYWNGLYSDSKMSVALRWKWYMFL